MYVIGTWRFASIAVAIASSCAVAGCRPSTPDTSGDTETARSRPDQILRWMGRGGGFQETNCGGDYVYAKSVEPEILDVWKWEGNALQEHKHVPLTTECEATWFGPDSYIYVDLVEDKRKRQIDIKSASTGSQRRLSARPDGWYCSLIQLSRNGTWVGFCRSEMTGENGPPDYEWKRPRMRIGLYSADMAEVLWPATLIGTRTGADGTVRSVVPSDDGRYVAVGGWDLSVAMIDVNAEKVLWVKKPGNNAVFYVAFSPDTTVVYTGGTEGIVYAMDVRTGATLSHWCATESGQEEYGHRISCLNASPDGRWVVAGTGPEGLIFVGDAANAKLVKVLEHGGSTVNLVHFSPNSKALASFVPGTLKIWNVSRWDQQADKTPRTQPSP